MQEAGDDGDKGSRNKPLRLRKQDRNRPQPMTH